MQNRWTIDDVKIAIVPDRKWVPYPDYSDRDGWDKLTGTMKDIILKDGEKAKAQQWNLVLATDYMEFERTGARTVMEQPYHANVNKLSSLMMAELAEGKGRFIDDIINGVWLFCDMKGWASPAHLNGSQPSRRALPDDSGILIDLVSGDLSALLSWCHYFFKDEMDKVNPYFSHRLKNELKIRTMDPYMENDNYWWQAFNLKPGGLVNNWNPWCNSNVLITFLLMEDNQARLAEAVYRSMLSVDKFLNYNNSDGACEEGPSYWGHAAGKLYDFLQVLSYATNGKINMFDNSMVKNMGEYIVNSYIGDGWVVNFADASAKGDGLSGLIYRYGSAVGSQPMQQFASYLLKSGSKEKYFYSGRDLFRTLENIRVYPQVEAASSVIKHNQTCWYPETEFCYMRSNDGWFFGAKGGYNDESHNHNDVGSFILFHNNKPVFVDAGVGTYTRKTFSSERYTIWTMQCNYHNLPIINGVPQSYGKKFRSADAAFNKGKRTFSLDISNAYAENAGVKLWNRSYTLKQKGGLVIVDKFTINSASSANVVNFLTCLVPDVSVKGIVTVDTGDKKVNMKYDSIRFDVSVDKIDLDDTRLSNVWGSALYRISLTAKQIADSGEYRFVIE